MIRLAYSGHAVADLERLAAFLHDEAPAMATPTARLITSALDILRAHPLIGRIVERDWRELVISRGRTGYIALYRYDEHLDQVVVHAIRHQREAGYQP
ncbi:MAG TPA: type II toxin-antitoxin system mRNA interferase toxin, RelE/StbE family [Kofleriaceae bacterium]|jgi:addiction module RelE/StbE family toxin|nr:type II toxin-antitoxin system mRNA interferase toxin, RelE/StbE family [Kofleriaceae bacterium]